MDHVPTIVPILSPGQHRTPRHGGCFMEIASLLAGERWSDHPRCTHPVLAVVARAVNDRTTDTGRSSLAPLIPSVIGTSTSDPRVAPLLVARCARAAIDVAPAHQRDDLARSLRKAQERLGGGPRARRGVRRYERVIAPRTINRSVSCLAATCDPAYDELLRLLLIGAISDIRALSAASQGGQPGVSGNADFANADFTAACELVGSVPLAGLPPDLGSPTQR